MTDDASPGTMNTRIIDSVTANAVLLTGQAPTQSFGILDTVMSETLGMSMHNAVMRQQADGMVGAAAMTAACAKMLQSNGVFAPPKFPPPPPEPLHPSSRIPPPIPPEPPPAPAPAAVLAQALAESELALAELKAQAATAQALATDAQHRVVRAEAELSALAKVGDLPLEPLVPPTPHTTPPHTPPPIARGKP
jgi:hypothetical protein